MGGTAQGRPRAYVSNLSCMTAQCHGDLKFMDKPLTLGTVKFVHSKHLQRDAEREKPHEQRLSELEKIAQRTRRRGAFQELDAVVSEAGPAEATLRQARATCARSGRCKCERATLVEFSQLRHRRSADCAA